MSDQAKIQKAFERGERLTVLDTFHRYSTFELKRYVYKLTKAGMNIVNEWQSNGVKRWKVYWLAR